MASKHTTDRRSFLKGLAAAAGAVAMPTIIPSSALGKDGAVAPSERINMCATGVGGMGTGDFNAFLGFREVQMVAVCDVDKNHRERSMKRANAQYKGNVCKSQGDCI